MKSYDHDRLAELLAALPPVPLGWEKAAQELPRIGRALDHLDSAALGDAAVESRVVDELESALAQAGIAAEERILAQARALLRSSS